ncbi:uncharacterized protein [Dermacentor albipictus]|uniref:uncharacterized protein n=1 Tax=Dermacentor albipictus TaxID=60249 RepID=UPI0031FC9440
MTATLNASIPAGEGPYSTKQVRLKLDNMNKRYRKLRRTATTTGSKAITWPLYRRLHGFLGALPVNDDLLMEENIEVQQVNELPNSAEVIASWDDGDIPTEESSVCQLSITPEPPTDSQTPEPSRDSPQPEVANDLGARAGSRSANSQAKGRKRPASTNFEELISLHKQAEQRAAKASKKIYKLHKTFIKLQAESNDMQASMIRMLEKYLVPNDQ